MKEIKHSMFRASQALSHLSKATHRSYFGCDEIDKEAAKDEMVSLRETLEALQARLWAERKSGLLLILQGLDTAGKDGTVRRVFSGFNPQGVKVYDFKVPSEVELSHDFLWRVHLAVPSRGEIALFNRSHYEDLLVPVVNRTISDAVFAERVQSINEFEAHLARNGFHVVKVFINISKPEQKARLQERIDDPAKNWKFDGSDLVTRSHFEEYVRQYARVIELTDHEHAPWYVVPGDQKWFRDRAVLQIVAHHLRSLDPKFPPPPRPLDGIVIPD
ncbi:MAG: polyphosphate kinase 2 family protein [Actinomycetota bacterium]|nr:polyphosphate kinase 2 family protein [Actinomycetota bacterium]